MKSVEQYQAYLEGLLKKTFDTQKQNLHAAIQLVTESILAGGRFYIFGSGHSHIIAEEVYNRAGGLAFVRAILEPSLMLHEEPNKSTYLERLDGYGEVLLRMKNVGPADTLMVVSNSGRNPVPVGMAIKAKEIGAKVVAMTSLTHSTRVTSRHKSGQRLFEVADVVIDNCAPFGDAGFYVEGLDTPTGSTSDFTGVALVHSLIVGTLEALVEKGFNPPVYKSSNVDGADAHNDALFEKYAK